MKAREAKNKKDTFSLRISLPGLLAVIVLIVVGMGWSFAIGVSVGRGHQPDEMARQMAHKILPETLPLLTEKNEEVLKSEELEFFDKLKLGPGSQVATNRLPKAAPPKKETKSEATPSTSMPALPNAPAPATPNAAVASARDEIFMYNYQVAALASMEQAQGLLKRLDAQGFKTSVVTATHEGKTWFRVYVHHQGTAQSVSTLKENLKGSGVASILLRSRTPL